MTKTWATKTALKNPSSVQIVAVIVPVAVPHRKGAVIWAPVTVIAAAEIAVTAVIAIVSSLGRPPRVHAWYH